MRKSLLSYSASGLLFLSMLACGLLSCEKPTEPVVDQPLTITLSQDSVLCLPIYKDLSALELSWTPGTNHGSGSAISYTVEMDKEGNNFAEGLKWEIGRTANRVLLFSHQQLANTLHQTYPEVEEGVYIVFECRVRAKIIQTGEEQVSNVARVAIAWHAAMMTHLYLVGDATPH